MAKPAARGHNYPAEGADEHGATEPVAKRSTLIKNAGFIPAGAGISEGATPDHGSALGLWLT